MNLVLGHQRSQRRDVCHLPAAGLRVLAVQGCAAVAAHIRLVDPTLIDLIRRQHLTATPFVSGLRTALLPAGQLAFLLVLVAWFVAG